MNRSRGVRCRHAEGRQRSRRALLDVGHPVAEDLGVTLGLPPGVRPHRNSPSAQHAGLPPGTFCHSMIPGNGQATLSSPATVIDRKAHHHVRARPAPAPGVAPCDLGLPPVDEPYPPFCSANGGLTTAGAAAPIRSLCAPRSTGSACYACDLPVISAGLGEAGSSVTMGALLCVLVICA